MFKTRFRLVAFLGVFLLAAVALVAGGRAYAQAKEVKYETYVNGKYNYSICYPAGAGMASGSERADGARFENGRNGFTLNVKAYANKKGASAQDILNSMVFDPKKVQNYTGDPVYPDGDVEAVWSAFRKNGSVSVREVHWGRVIIVKGEGLPQEGLVIIAHIEYPQASDGECIRQAIRVLRSLEYRGTYNE